MRAEWVFFSGVPPLNASDFAYIERTWKLTNGVGMMYHPNLISLHNKFSGVTVDIFMQKDHISVLFESQEKIPIFDSCNSTYHTVHVGFLYDKLYRTIRNSVKETLKSMLRASAFQKPIVAGGKHVGGALAQLFAYDTYQEWNKSMKVLKAVIMFDTPKVGTYQFSENLCRHLQCVRVLKEKSYSMYTIPKERNDKDSNTFGLSEYEILYDKK